ncbi:hypothetical protein EHQ53_17285 [Leptospira langatensis]|uniref:Uncharacterized protein n=1 Tax=Leptospira langatensis TaxID=2484983 RepID=A0A5F1ZR26_9LEPT|nr:hypothetical protein [Leptospira langatensis]TGK05390.1 hypothetical protein EHO57_01525 [Leptospira langatensis]TGL38526.1 hypothetical protein EHQ53_17285 [Leptospira langatensis]
MTKRSYRPYVPKKVLACLCFGLSIFLTEPVFSQSGDYFADLTSERKPIMGSDKEDKYVFRFPILANVESWGPHFSVDAMVLFSYTNYPKFKEVDFFPLFNHLWAKENSSYRSYFFPFYYSDRIETSKGISGSNYSLLHYNTYKTSPTYSSELWRFPSFLPLAGSEVKKEGDRVSVFRYALPLLFFRNKTPEEERTHFLLFHWGKDKDSSYGAVLPLLYWGSGVDRSHFTLFPFVYYDSLNSGKEGSFLTPLFGRTWKDYGSGENSESDRFSYILPFFRSSLVKNGEIQNSQTFVPIVFSRKYAKDLGTRTNLLLLSGWKSDAKGDYASSYFFPLFFHEKGTYLYFLPFLYYRSNEYFSLLPFLVKGNRQGEEYTLIPPLLTYWDKETTWIFNTYVKKDKTSDQYSNVTVFPFWFYSNDGKNKSHTLFPIFQVNRTESSKEIITPLYYSYEAPKESYSLIGPLEFSKSEEGSGFRIYPFFYTGNTKQDSYWNFLGLAGRGFDQKGDAKYTYAFPLYFYQRDSYRVAIPFFFRLGYDEGHYTHFGIFHYWNRSPEKDNTWIWPLLWFSNVDKVQKEDFSVWFPLYWNWNTPRSKGDIFLPFYLNYEEADKSLQLVLAYSSSKTLGTFNGALGVGSTEREYYLDTDLSLFYNLFSVSTRASIDKQTLQFWKEKHPQETQNGPEAGPIVPSEETGKEGLNKYNRLTRDRVRSFWGISALFGIFSYEEGDDRRHFRLLPLSWFSWSKKTEDKVYAAPFFFSSRIGDESYFVLFPFYGRQDQAKNFQESYLLFGFLRGKKGETRDYSVLWPLTRFYYSPESWGIRVFPLFAHDESKEMSRTISLLYYKKRISEGDSTNRSFHSILIPLYHSGSDLVHSKDGLHEESYDTLLPLYWRSATRDLSGSSEKRETTTYTLLSKYSNTKETDGATFTSFFSPFYFYQTYKLGKQSEEEATKIDFLLFPGLYWERNKTDSIFFLLGFYREKTQTFSQTSFLGLISSSESKEKGQGETSFRIAPFYSNTETVSASGKSKTVWGIPFYYNRTENVAGGWGSTSVNPFGVFSSYGGKDTKSESSFWFLPIPFLYTENNIYDSGIASREISFLKLISYTRREDLKSAKSEKTELSALFLFSTRSESYEDQKGKNYEFESYFFPIYWLNRETRPDSKRTHLNFLIFFDYAKDTDRKESRLILGPYYTISSSTSENYGFLPLGLVSRDQESKLWFLLGAYGYKDSTTDRWGFAGIFDTNYEETWKRRNLNFFLGLIHTELEEQRTRVAILGGILGGYESRPDYSDTNLLWLRWRSSPGDTLANFLPVYYYHSDAAGTSTLVPPVLGYFSSEKDGRFDMLGLGLLYYRNQKISKEEDLMLVGPGLFYYRKYPNSNGLNAMGILAVPGLGGLLWDWEYEERTKYSRHAIFSVLYSNVTNKEGKTTNKIFGIPVW